MLKSVEKESQSSFSEEHHRQIVKKRAQIITVYEKEAGGRKGKALGGICNVYLSAKSSGAREKQLKGWRRSKKVSLINAVNPTWRDLRGGAPG